MADFYPLITRTLAGLPADTAQARAQLYGRLRDALARQIAAADPPLGEAEVMRQRLSLDEAITRVERERAPAGLVADPTPEPAKILRPHIDPRAAAIASARASWRAWLAGLVIVLATGGVGVLAWTLRDDPKRFLASADTETPPAESASPTAPPKRSVRIGETPPADAAPAPPAPAPPPTPASAPKPEPTALPTDTAIIAQRGTLIRTNEDRTKPPEVLPGRVVWQMIQTSSSDGRPPEPAIRIEFTFDQAEITGSILLRRNRDPALPASHTIEIVFTPKPGADPVVDIQLPQFKEEETLRGAPLFGLPFPVGENLFVVALSAVKRDVDRNLELILDKGWFDLPFIYKSGRRAMFTVERGISGEQIVKKALEAWGRS